MIPDLVAVLGEVFEDEGKDFPGIHLGLFGRPGLGGGIHLLIFDPLLMQEFVKSIGIDFRIANRLGHRAPFNSLL